MEGTLMLGLTLALFVSVLWPQTGYIHPDEFFQSTEVVAGDVFNITHLRTWEFQTDMPLRDISVPYLLFAPGFYVLRTVLGFLQSDLLSHFIVESYTILVIPRVLLAVAGIVNYCLVKKLCRVFRVDKPLAEWYWLTSYVTWTFLTRSFSNTTETLLCSVACLLLFHSAETVRHIALCNTDRPGNLPSESRKERKVRLYSFLVGSILCVGIFNRPTFGVFVLGPLMWWMDQLGSAKLRKTLQLTLMFLTGVGFVLTFVVMSVSNSLYYNSDFSHLLYDAHVSILNGDINKFLDSACSVMHGLRIPPWSFVQYNLLASNLAQHGLHPWYTHLFVNFPLLTGPVAVLFFYDVIMLIKHFRHKHSTDILFASVIIPIISLSFFPHQEARFLLPLVVFVPVCAAKNSLAGWRSFKAVALVFNLVAFVFFGWFHQGGVVPALSALQSRMKTAAMDPANYGTQYHVISYTTYMLPRHLLFADGSRIQVHVDDMIGAHNHPLTLKHRVEKLKAACVNQSVACQFFLLLPVPALLDVRSVEGWQLQEGGQFCPHVSMEKLPTQYSLRTLKGWHDLMSQLCLKVMLVKP